MPVNEKRDAFIGNRMDFRVTRHPFRNAPGVTGTRQRELVYIIASHTEMGEKSRLTAVTYYCIFAIFFSYTTVSFDATVE